MISLLFEARNAKARSHGPQFGVEMIMMTTPEELENRYLAVLRSIEDTSAVLGGMSQEISIILSNKKLDDCLARLDAYAENLQRLDARLSKIVDADEDVMGRSEKLPKYAALMQLGTSGYDRLYQDYSTLRKLRDRKMFLILSLTGVAVISLSALILSWL